MKLQEFKKRIVNLKKKGFIPSTRKGLYYTTSLKPNSTGLFLHVDNKDISIRHISGTVIAI